MSAVKAVRYLLAHNAGLTGVVPAARIAAGTLPQNTAMPAVVVSHVSTVRRNTVSGAETSQFCTGRVQVSVKAATYASMRQVLDLVIAALPRSRGTVNGVKVDAVMLDTEGPDFSDEESGIFMGSHDFIVTFNS
jgi:hypothetical protein